jgi:hypothetical protein
MPGDAADWPMPIWTCWNHWIAVSTGDQAGVMQTLGLSRPSPITFAQAQEVIDADGHDDSEDRRHLFRVFVTIPTTASAERTYSGCAANSAGVTAGRRRTTTARRTTVRHGC